MLWFIVQYSTVQNTMTFCFPCSYWILTTWKHGASGHTVISWAVIVQFEHNVQVYSEFPQHSSQHHKRREPNVPPPEPWNIFMLWKFLPRLLFWTITKRQTTICLAWWAHSLSFPPCSSCLRIWLASKSHDVTVSSGWVASRIWRSVCVSLSLCVIWAIVSWLEPRNTEQTRFILKLASTGWLDRIWVWLLMALTFVIAASDQKQEPTCDCIQQHSLA